MPKEIASQEFEHILNVISTYVDGVDGVTLAGRLDGSFPKRTLQRRLKQLEENGRLRSTGRGRGKRYFPINKSILTTSPPSSIVAEDKIIFNAKPSEAAHAPPSPEVQARPLSLSIEASRLRDAVRVPLPERKPVPYKINFLNSYQPNETFYLPLETRQRLARIGQCGGGDLPAGTYIRQILDRLIIDLSWNSSRLEGNTYSLLETEILFEIGKDAQGRRFEETQMVLNHKAALEMLAEEAGKISFNRYTICNLHALLADNLMHNQKACGLVRTRAVGIGGTVYHPLSVPSQVEEAFLKVLEKAEAIRDPFEQAFFSMVHLPYLQPFEDVNKRTSRLAANIPLIKENLCPLSFIDVPRDDYISGLLAVYELNRVDYLMEVFVWAYERSAARYAAVVETLGEPDPFRLRYRRDIGECVREVVLKSLSKEEAVGYISQEASRRVGPEDQSRLVEMIEGELKALHMGNIVRHKLSLGEFEKWEKLW